MLNKLFVYILLWYSTLPKCYLKGSQYIGYLKVFHVCCREFNNICHPTQMQFTFKGETTNSYINIRGK